MVCVIYQHVMSSSASELAAESKLDYLLNHPRMLGVLFMVLFLLSQTGNASAAIAGGFAGP